MPNIQLFAKQQHTGKYVALDLHAEAPIKLDLSVANINQPTDTNSIFSKKFKVPNTAVNGPYFEGVFNVNSMNFDASIKADAYILDNGIFFENGNIRLDAVYNNTEDNIVEYEITFYGSTSDFGSKIGGGFLNEVNLNMYNHTKNYANIQSSWTTPGLFNGDVVYGLIEWGYSYNDKNQPSVPTLSANFTPSAGSPATAKGSFTYPLYPYLLQQWKPQIRAKALWDRIFEESGYTYDSAFLDSDFFKKQYIISDNQARAILDNANTFEAENQGIYLNVLAASFPWITPTENSDPGNNFTTSAVASGTYTAPSAGQYTFNLECQNVKIIPLTWGAGASNYGWIAKAIDVDTNLTVGFGNGSFIFDTFNQYQANLNVDLNTNLTAGQKLKFEFSTFYISGPGGSGSTQIYYYNQKLRCTVAPNIMSFNAIMPSNIRKIDFMKSIINRYRLVFVPSKFQENHFTITPWKDWILQGRSKDWTDKLDTSKDMVIKPLFFDQARFQIYKDQEDSDYLNYNYQLGVKQTFGQLNLDSTNELIKGIKEYKDQFAPTPLDSIGWRGITSGGWSSDEAAKFLIPHIAKDTGGNADVADAVAVGKREPIQPKLRLVFYNGLRTVPGSPTPREWYMADDSGTPQAQTTYPLMSQYSEFPVTSSTFDLNWENDLPLWDVLQNGKAQTPFSCFNVFWKTWYDVTFDPYSRIVDANFVLDYSDILDLKFNDYIFVKDAWYFVNSVSDYVAGERSNCRVQLVKLGNNIGVTLPVITPPTYTATPVCYHPTNECASYCCSQTQGATNTTIYIDGPTLVTSATAYNEAAGGIFASPGYYTNVDGTVQINSSGVMSVLSPDCSCTPVYYTFTVYNNTSGCRVCCNDGPTITVYGANATFELNNSFYSNTLLTAPAPQGFYMTSTSANALQIGVTGNVINTFLCENCDCVTYYPFTVCFSTSLCNACCCTGKGGSRTVYGTNPNFLANSTLYNDNTGTVPVIDGYYKLNSTSVARVTGGSGAVTQNALCTSCTPCDYPPIDFPIGVTVNVTVGVPGYTTSTLLQKSYDAGASWVDVTAVTISPTDVYELSKSAEVAVEVDVLLRAISTSTTDGGSLEANYYIGADQVSSRKVVAPSSITLTTSATQLDTNYEFNAIVSGGEPIAGDDTLLVCGKFESYQGDTDYTSVIALDANDADINTDIEMRLGFELDGVYPGECESIIKVGDIIVVAGTFTSYQGGTVHRCVTGLNLDGYVNTEFDTNISALSENQKYRLAYIDETKFAVWPTETYGFPADGFDLATVDDTGTVITVVGEGYPVSGNATGFDDFIDRVVSYNNQLYVIGSFSTYRSPSNVLTTGLNKIARLTMDLEIDTTFDTGTGFAVYRASDIAVGTQGVYMTFRDSGSSIPTFDGTDIPGSFFKINFDGSIDTEFLTNIGDGKGTTGVLDTVQVDADGIWVLGDFSSWDGVTPRDTIVRLNLDGTYNSDFINNVRPDPITVGTNVIGGKLYGNDLYVYGNFDNYKGVQNDGLMKLNKFTGAVDATFAVGTGFDTEPGDTNFVRDVFRFSPLPAPTLYLTDTSYSEIPCVAFCNTAYATPVYANATPLVNATKLYTNVAGTAPAPAGYYATGNTIAEVDGSGVIIAFYDTASCTCDNLYQYDVEFDIDRCISCGTTGTPAMETVFGSNSVWSRNRVLYSNSAGTSFALPGFYTYAGSIVLEVGDNGNVISVFDCAEVCPPEFTDCRLVSVINNSPEGIWVYYQTCESCGTVGMYENLYLPYGQETDLGGLVVFGSVSTSGTSKIIYGAIC